MNNEKNETRKNFLGKIGRGVAGFTLLTVIPSALLGKSSKKFEGIKVKIHPDAVKRNK